MISIIRRIKIKYILIMVFWLFIWELLYLLVDQPLFLASPADTFSVLIRKMIKMPTWVIIGNTTFRILIGYAVAFIAGIISASAAYASPGFEETVKPVMTLIKSIPVASFIVLVLAWLSAAHISGFITGFVVFPMIYFSVLANLRRVDRNIMEMCRVFRVSFIKKVRYVFAPKIAERLPELLKTTIGMGIRAAIAAELIGIPSNSIGEAIYKAKLYFDISDLFAWTIITVILCYVLEKTMIYFSRIMRRLLISDRSN